MSENQNGVDAVWELRYMLNGGSYLRDSERAAIQAGLDALEWKPIPPDWENDSSYDPNVTFAVACLYLDGASFISTVRRRDYAVREGFTHYLRLPEVPK